MHISLFLIISRILRVDGEKYPPHLDDSIHSHHRECCCVSAGTTHFRHRDGREGEADELCAASLGGAESSRRASTSRGGAVPNSGLRGQEGAPTPRDEGHAKWRGALEVSQASVLHDAEGIAKR